MSESYKTELHTSEVKVRRQLIGTLLKDWRRSAKLSQAFVASQLNYASAQFVSNWERGISMPPLDVLPKLMELYNIPADTMADTVYRYQERLLALHHSQISKMLHKMSTRKTAG